MSLPPGCEACMSKISVLIAERDALRAELAEALQANELYCEDQNEKAEEIERLRAEIERPENERVKQLKIAQASIDNLEREIRRLRALIANGNFKDLYAEGLTVGQRLGRAENKKAIEALTVEVNERGHYVVPGIVDVDARIDALAKGKP